ncbi:MAG: archease [Acidobacteriota bacterium]|nr:MAG: archease [Acidobacteriota bacterium]
MTRGKVAYELVEHTADTGIVVRSTRLEKVFEFMASAMFDQIVDVDAIRVSDPPELVRVEANDEETLLVAWLGELLSRAMAAGLVYGAFDVAIGPVEGIVGTVAGGLKLIGRVWGEPLDLERHGFKAELKAVTYHHLFVGEQEDGFVARVVFDV